MVDPDLSKNKPDVGSDVVDRTIGKMKTLSDQLKVAAKMNELQTAEFSRQQAILKSVEQLQTVEKEATDQLIDELMVLNKKQTVLETMSRRQTEKNAELEQVIGVLAVEIQQKKRLTEDMKFCALNDERKFNVQSKIMEEHKKKIYEHEKANTIFESLHAQRAINEMLKLKRDEMHANKFLDEFNSEEKGIQERITDLENLKKDLLLKTEIKEQQVKEIKGKQLQAQQEIKVVKKHNAARLLRLRCQLKEAQTHMRCAIDAQQEPSYPVCK